MAQEDQPDPEAQSTAPDASIDQAAPGPPSDSSAKSVPRRTNAGRFWFTLGVAIVIAILLIIFIAENSQRVTVHYLGANGSISAALALLIAAVAGAIIMLLAGTVRIVQLRGEVKHERRRRRGG